MTIRNTTFANALNGVFSDLIAECATILFIVLLPQIVLAQSINGLSDESLLEQYVQSKNGIIVFDASNIKQFWISNSVASMKNNINIVLDKKSNLSFESVPLKIQLANVGTIQDCKVDVITENTDFSFTVADANLKSVASSVQGEDFLHYHTYSSGFHLVNTQGFSFNLIFASKSNDVLNIKKIYLSFSQNKDFLSSPGELHPSKDNILFKNSSAEQLDGASFSITGTRSEFSSLNSILVGDSPITSSLTIKNTGNTPTTIYVGYVPYTSSGERIDNRTTPYKGNNKILKVLSSESNSNKIIVDDYPEWTKGCFVALNAKEDLSDFPNCSYIDGSVVEVNKIDEGKVEIVFDKPLKNQIAKGTSVRMQSPHGSSCLYTNTQKLQPGEEATLSSSIKKDETVLQYSSNALSRGVYYVIPIVLSYSVGGEKPNTILISDYTINY